MKKKYGPIESMAIVRRKTGKKIVDLIPVYTNDIGGFVRAEVDVPLDMLIRVVTRDEQGRRVTFFMKKI